jgi:hypothetical protein
MLPVAMPVMHAGRREKETERGGGEEGGRQFSQAVACGGYR